MVIEQVFICSSVHLHLSWGWSSQMPVVMDHGVVGCCSAGYGICRIAAVELKFVYFMCRYCPWMGVWFSAGC